MRLNFFGAVSTVTGSRYLLEENNERYMVDCGLFQGLKELRLRNREPFPVDPATIKAILLTHAHLDHSGYLPLIVKQGFKGPIFASKATCELSEILLLDAGRIQEEDARRANHYHYTKHPTALPLYTEEDAKRAIAHLKPVDFDHPFDLANHLSVKFSHAGHILGSAMISFRTSKTSLLFTGDLGRPHDPIMIHPAIIDESDYLVIESTYGARKHPNDDILSKLAAIINTTFSRGGKVFIPAFAIGRTQILLYYLEQLKQRQLIPQHTPVYVDSPMAEKATKLWCSHSEEHIFSEDERQQVCALPEYIESTADSKQLNSSPFPSVVISASGMVEGGRILHHLTHALPKSENTIIFSGFQSAGTRGERILRGEKEIKIHGQMVPVRAHIERLEGLSSHADYTEILSWLANFKRPPKETFITHGEPQSALALQKAITTALGWKAHVPTYLEAVMLE